MVSLRSRPPGRKSCAVRRAFVIIAQSRRDLNRYHSRVGSRYQARMIASQVCLINQVLMPRSFSRLPTLLRFFAQQPARGLDPAVLRRSSTSPPAIPSFTDSGDRDLKPCTPGNPAQFINPGLHPFARAEPCRRQRRSQKRSARSVWIQIRIVQKNIRRNLLKQQRYPPRRGREL